MPLLSVIVPIYKVEKYLSRCVESIQNQTIKDIEIILVDDGSPDNCPKICDKYALGDARIQVIHKENGGLSSARNAGINAATGKYLGFVDADDSVIPEMYEIMINTIESENVDFVMADYTRVLSDGTSYLKSANIRGGYYGKKDLQDEIYPSLIMGNNIEYGPLLSVWHCLYNTQFLKENDIWFDEEVRWSEDNIFSAIVGYCANSFYYLKGYPLYNYHQNMGTITTSYKSGAWNVYCLMNEHLKRYFEKKKIYDFTQQLKWHIIYYACVCIGQAFMLDDEKRKEVIIEILDSKELKKAFINLDYSGMNTKLKLQLMLMKYNCYTILEKIYLRRNKIK